MKKLVFPLLALGLFLLLASGPIDIEPVTQASDENNCVPAPSGLVSWWPGDGNANDIQDGNHGTLQNGATFATGLVGPGFSFDGIDDFVEVPNSPSLMIAGAFTVEFWFKLNATHDPFSSAAPGFLSKGFFDSINLANNDGRLEVRGPTPRPNSTTNTWLAGVWYHVAVTYNAIEYKIYVNGTQEGGVLSSYSILNNTDNIAIGSIPAFLPGPVTTNGLVDEMTIYNRALTASEVQAIFNAGSAGKCKDADGDGVNDTEDNCLTTPNADQSDFDLDGLGDACDTETGPPRFKDQCKDDGWMRFNFPRAFTNQGDCIQFVNTGK